MSERCPSAARRAARLPTLTGALPAHRAGIAGGTCVALLASLLLSACAVSRSRGHAEVAAIIEQRLGIKTHWDQGSPADAEVRKVVDRLLENGLSRERAIEIALVNNHALQATYEELGISQADMVQAGLLKNPSLGFALGLPLNVGARELEGSLVQDFLDLLVLPMRKKIARQRFEADILRVADQALRVAADVGKEFAAVQASQKLLEFRREVAAAAEAGADLADRQFEAGNISELAHATERAVSEQAALELAHEEMELAGARERLNRLLGLWGPRIAWRIPQALAELPADDLALDQLERLAMKQRLDVDYARKREAMFTRAVAMAKNFRLFGKIEVGAQGHQDPDGPRVIGPSITLELPIFDQRQAEIARLEAERRQSEWRLQEVAVDARSEVRVAVTQMATARRMAERYRDRLLPLRTQIVEQTQRHYNGMLLGFYQLLEAKQAQVEAYRGYVMALRDYWAARAELERAVGGRLSARTASAVMR